MTTDPIADMITRIRNSIAVSKDSVTIPYSKIKHNIAKILVASGYLTSVEIEKNGVFKNLVLSFNQEPANKKITALIRVSKPGRRVYAKKDEVPRVLNGHGIVIVSTSAGLMTGQQAKKKGLGGELICKVY